MTQKLSETPPPPSGVSSQNEKLPPLAAMVNSEGGRKAIKSRERVDMECPTCKNIFRPLKSRLKYGVKYCGRKCHLARPVQTAEAKFLSQRIATSKETCWNWNGTLHKDGYGVFYTPTRSGDKKTLLAHRFAWELVNGNIPAGLCICHKCDNPRCVNTNHLFVGTQLDNIADMVAKGRGRHLAGVEIAMSKLNDEKVRQMRAIRTAESTTLSVLADRFGVTKATVSKAINLQTWKHVV